MNYYGELSNEETELELLNRKLSREIAREGFVLLKNNGALPLVEKHIALYGVGARKTVKGGTGSGSVNERYSVSIEDGLVNSGFLILTKELLDKYDELYLNEYSNWRDRVEKMLDGRSIMETIGMVVATPFKYPEFPIIDDAVECDTAIYVLTRQAGEGNDRRNEEGDYILTKREIGTITKLRSLYKNLILIVNVGGFIEISEITNYFDSIVYFGQGGEEGGNALADVLTGRYSFSGKLTNTWAENYYDYPNAENFGYLKDDLDNENYTEGIYVGYRYFDSYKKKVLFPFGYGKSYTDFEINTKDVVIENEIVKLQINIKNIGDIYAGKEVVQVYVSCPQGKLDKEYQRLVAFDKTTLLSIDENEDMEITFELNSLTSYDEDIASYILEKGDYIVRVGNSSDNTKPVAVLNINNSVITEKCEKCCSRVEALDFFEKPGDYEHDNNNVKYIDVNTDAIIMRVNEYKDPVVCETDLEKEILDKLSTEEKIELLYGGNLRDNTQGHIILGAAGKTTLKLLDKGVSNITMSDGPAGLNICNHLKKSESGIEMPLKVPERFNWGDAAKKSEEAAKNFVGEEVYRYATAWPVSMVIAQSFNLKLAKSFGEAVGKEMKAFGITLWLAPGMNINRNPLCGRLFEYFSEDPVVSGEFAKNITLGTQSQSGKGVTIKHFACNNQEDNRTKVSANVSERALREIYLKGFEIAIKKSSPKAIMSSYNKINGVYTPNNYDLLTKIARNEWGFNGLVMTDWYSCNDGLGKPELCALSGNDLIMPGDKNDYEKILENVNNGNISEEVLRNCACRVLRVILDNNSNMSL